MNTLVKLDLEFFELEKLLLTEPELRKPSDLSKIQTYLLKYQFFQQLQRDYHINNLVDCAIYFKYTRYQPGDIIFSVSEQSLYFYLLLKGNISVYYNNEVIRKYKEGVFEECSLVERRKHDTTVIAIEESHVLYIDYQIYSGLFFSIREKKRIAIVSFLQIQKAFKGWTRAKLMSMSYVIHELEVDVGTVIFNAGDIADKVYIVHDGVAVIKDQNFLICKSGDIIGVDDITKNRCRGSKCISQSKCTLLYIFKHDYLEKAKLFKKKRVFPKNTEQIFPVKQIFGLSIQSFAPEDNKPIRLIHFSRESNRFAIRPNSTSSMRPQTGNTYTQRPKTSISLRGNPSKLSSFTIPYARRSASPNRGFGVKPSTTAINYLFS